MTANESNDEMVEILSSLYDHLSITYDPGLDTILEPYMVMEEDMDDIKLDDIPEEPFPV